ncbi:monocyte to macrophage differentiation factor 2-like isoform X2 [Myxocyprinus asiaticus]|nr:monocyte to macrophage differentiation factor 2-like isoform X2 [Myxocyprinus asiaticus]
MGSSVLYFLSDDQWETISAWMYGTGLSGLFIMSTMFHTVSWKKSHHRKVEQRFHMCDRMVIYFFIAASYAPWLNLRELGPWAVHMRWLVWIMACAGSAYVFFFHEKNKILDLLCYTAMGAVPAIVLLSMPKREGIVELSVGGVFYCLGIVFFKSDGLIPFAHAIWHVFVAVGAGIHYYAIWRYLYAPGTSQIQIPGPLKLHQCTAIFRSLQRCSIGFKSGLWLGHSRTFTELSRSHSFVILAVCLGSLSCWKMNLHPSLRSRALWSRFSSRMSLYIAAFIFPSILTSLPVPAAEKHPHSMMLPPPCFTVGMVLAR